MGTKLVSSPPESLLARLTPTLRAKYEAFAGLVDEARLAPPDLLALGRATVDAAHGLGAWPRPATAAERAVCAVAEKIPFAYLEIGDADFAALRAQLADAQVVPLVMALCLHDAHRRVQIAWPELERTGA
jgi:hypothetical protein